MLWSCALLIIAIGAISAKPVYHWLKTRRAHQLAADAASLVQAGKLNEAAAKYRAALQLDPLGYQPLAGAARLATRGGRPEAMDLWREVIRRPQSTIEDRQEYANLLVQRGTLRPAEKLIEELLQRAPNEKTLSLATQYYEKAGNESKALELARRALARAPDDEAMRFRLAELLAKSSDAAQRAEARKTLWSLAEKDGRLQKSALEALARAPELSPEEESKIIATLAALPQADAVSDLLGAELKLKLQPGSADKIYQDAITRWSSGQTADVAELARWLNLHRQSERVLSFLPIERARTVEPLLLSRLDALANLERWKEIDALLERPDLGLDPTVTESFRARNAMGEGSSFDAELHWDRAITLAGGDPFKLRFVASFAEQSHAATAALKAYDLLGKFPEHATFAQRGRQRLIEQTGDVSAAREVAERLTTLAPDDVNAQAELVHLNLLLGTDVDANLAKAKELVAKHPERLSFRVTAALGFLRKHDPASALAQFKGPAIDWSRTPPGWCAVYVLVLSENGQAQAATELLKKIPLDRLNNEERELLASLTNDR
ncbi:MAG: tetratricopeptide repeat protein [Chthoniobacterales bacterium]